MRCQVCFIACLGHAYWDIPKIDVSTAATASTNHHISCHSDRPILCLVRKRHRPPNPPYLDGTFSGTSRAVLGETPSGLDAPLKPSSWTPAEAFIRYATPEAGHTLRTQIHPSPMRTPQGPPTNLQEASRLKPFTLQIFTGAGCLDQRFLKVNDFTH